MKFIIYDNEADAQALVDRANVATGYPHGITYNAVGIEKAYNQDLWATGVAVAWSWAHDPPRYYDIENEMLTEAERSSLVSFQYLIDHGWYGPE